MVTGLWITCGVLVVGLVFTLFKIINTDDKSTSLINSKREVERLTVVLNKIELEIKKGKQNGFRILFTGKDGELMEEIIIAESFNNYDWNEYAQTETKFHDVLGNIKYTIKTDILRVVERTLIDIENTTTDKK